MNKKNRAKEFKKDVEKYAAKYNISYGTALDILADSKRPEVFNWVDYDELFDILFSEEEKNEQT